MHKKRILRGFGIIFLGGIICFYILFILYLIFPTEFCFVCTLARVPLVCALAILIGGGVATDFQVEGRNQPENYLPKNFVSLSFSATFFSFFGHFILYIHDYTIFLH